MVEAPLLTRLPLAKETEEEMRPEEDVDAAVVAATAMSPHFPIRAGLAAALAPPRCRGPPTHTAERPRLSALAC